MKVIFCAHFLLLIFTINRIFAETSGEIPSSFSIHGNEMQYEFKKGEAYINGNAYAERTFFQSHSHTKKQLLTADSFYIRFKPGDPSIPSQDFQNIDFIEAKNNVTFTDQDLIIKADHCIYFIEVSSNKSQPAGRITCSQQVTLKKGEHTLKGDKAEANLQDGTYKIYSLDPSKKVKAVLSPQNNPLKK